MEKFGYLVGQTVTRLFLVVWPPWGEAKMSDVDISFGFVFNEKPDELCVVSTDKNDLCSPCISCDALPQVAYSWPFFETRMKYWMSLGEEESEEKLDTEYYEVTSVPMFKDIVHHKIESVDLVFLQNDDTPLGVRINFPRENILSIPITDGNTVITSRFNQNNLRSMFEAYGTIVIEPIEW